MLCLYHQNECWQLSFETNFLKEHRRYIFKEIVLDIWTYGFFDLTMIHHNNVFVEISILLRPKISEFNKFLFSNIATFFPIENREIALKCGSLVLPPNANMIRDKHMTHKQECCVTQLLSPSAIFQCGPDVNINQAFRQDIWWKTPIVLYSAVFSKCSQGFVNSTI